MRRSFATASGAARAEEGCLAPVPPLDDTVRGAIASGGIGTSMVGDSLMFELGGQWTGVRSSSGGRWLLQWDGFLAARGGYLANEHPYLFLIGGHELARAPSWAGDSSPTTVGARTPARASATSSS